MLIAHSVFPGCNAIIIDGMPLAAGVREMSFGRQTRGTWFLLAGVAAGVAFAVVARAVGADRLRRFDAAALIVRRARGQMDASMLAVSNVGHEISMSALALMSAAVLWRSRHPCEGAFVLASSGGGLVLAHLLPRIFRRPRPIGPPYRIPMPSTFSFPSGHMMVTTAVLASVTLATRRVASRSRLRPAAALATSCLVPAVAVSRLYFGVHYPSDIVGAQLASMAWVSTIAAFY